jgi:hypothetical protein
MPTLQRILVGSAFAILILACSVSTGNSSKPAAGAESPPKAASDEAAAEPEGADQHGHVMPKEAEPDDAAPDEAEPKKPESKHPAAASGDIKAASPTKCKDGHEVGDRWKDDCNDCWCKEGGNIVCTRKMCKKD